MVFFGNRVHGLREHAIDAELDDHGIIAGLNVNIAGPALQRGEDRGIHEPDDRAHVALRGQLVDRDALVAALFFGDNV